MTRPCPTATGEEGDVLRYLTRLDLVPGTSIEVVLQAPFDGPVTVRAGGADHAIARDSSRRRSASSDRAVGRPAARRERSLVPPPDAPAPSNCGKFVPNARLLTLTNCGV